MKMRSEAGEILMETMIAMEIKRFKRDRIIDHVEHIKEQLKATVLRAELAEDVYMKQKSCSTS
jgi:hypothetical protein